MRFFSELSVFITLTIAPLLVLGGLSFHITIPAIWILITGVISTLFALATLVRVHQRIVRPLQELIANLYAHRDALPQTGNHEFRQLDQAIRFYVTTGNANTTSKIESLEQQLADEALAREDATRIINNAQASLDARQREVEQQARDLETRHLLATSQVKRLLTVANVSGLTQVAVSELEDLQLLTGSATNSHIVGPHDLLHLIDRVTVVLAPLTRRHSTTIHVEFDDSCPRYWELKGDLFKACLLQLLVGHLAQPEPAGISIRISHTDKAIILQFPRNFTPGDILRIEEELASTSAVWNRQTLTWPASPVNEETPPQYDLIAIVISDNDRERTSLTQRLSFLGVTTTTDFRNPTVNLCLIADENSHSFHSINPHLSDTTFRLLLNNRQQYQDPRWITLSDPVTQTGLQSALTQIQLSGKADSARDVLLVDDSEVNVRLLETQLQELGHSVITADSGETAVTLASQHAFAVIFMDIQLPGIDGLEATRRIRKNDRFIPIIGLTAHATLSEKHACFESGMMEVLIKPVRLANLETLMQRFTSSGAPGSTAAPGQGDQGTPIGSEGVGSQEVGSQEDRSGRVVAGKAEPVFDMDLALTNANGRPELAAELFGLLVESLPGDLDAINSAAHDEKKLSAAVHKLHGALRYCGVPRLASAVENLERALKQGDASQVPFLLNLVNGEVVALNTWSRDHAVFSLPDVPASLNKLGQANPE